MWAFFNMCVILPRSAAGSCTTAQETYTYNNRLQAARIELGTTSGSPSADYCFVYNYYSDKGNPTSCAAPSQGSKNNGNVMGYWYQDSVNSSFSHTATYTYDTVNRLMTAVAAPIPLGTYGYNLTFSYKTPDNSTGQYGNMSCVTNAQTVGYCLNLSFNAANNQISTSGYTYDAAGNLTKDSSNLTAHTYQWDAEGRVSVVDPGSSPTWSFTYNALGHRAQWAYGSSGGADQHLFDPAGTWLGNYGEYTLVRFGDRMLVTYESSETYFNHFNFIGSTSMLTNHAGAAAEDMLFYPWGDVWQSWGTGGYGFANLPYNETTTNTSVTLNRFYSMSPGRWLSPDPIGVKAVKLDDPQTWNMYAYVRNSPTTLTDPNGLTIDEWWNRIKNAVKWISTAELAGAIQWTAEDLGHHVGNVVSGHSWNYLRESVTSRIVPESEPNPVVAVATDALGIAGAATGHTSLGYLGAATSLANDQSLQNVVTTVGGTIPETYLPELNPAFFWVGVVGDVGSLGGQFVVNYVMTPMLDAAPSQTIPVEGGGSITNPAVMDACEVVRCGP
jgi:RHS repeat-associated protein